MQLGNVSGLGTATWEDSGCQYMGQWRKGAPDGLGLLNLGQLGRYVGQWGSGYARGLGVMYMSEGCKYEGHWAGDCRNGTGAEYENGKLAYAGIYRGGKRHGEGLSITIDPSTQESTVMTCEYYEGELVREVAYENEEKGQWYEEDDVCKAAEQAAKQVRDVAVEVAKMLKLMQEKQQAPSI